MVDVTVNIHYMRAERMQSNYYLMLLPEVMYYLCPEWVTFIGLAAVAAGFMSSADSFVLSTSSIFTRNVYKHIFRKKVSKLEMLKA